MVSKIGPVEAGSTPITMDPVSPPLTGVAADTGRFVLVPHSMFPDVEIGPAYPGHGWVARHV